MLWVVLSLVGALSDSMIFLLTKKLVGINYFFATWLKFSIGLPFLALFLLFSDMPKLDMIFFIAVILNAILIFVAMYLIIKAIQTSDLAKTIPLLSLTPLFLLIFAFFINHELPNRYGIAGIFLTVMGAYSLNMKKGQGIYKSLKTLWGQKGSFLLLIVAIIYGITSSIGKLGITHSNGSFFSFSTYFVATIFFSPAFFYGYKIRLKEFRMNSKYLILTGVFSGIMMLTTSIAMQTTLVSYVISLKRLSALFSVLLGYYYFNERGLKQNLFGTMIMLIGAAIIIIFNS